MTTLGVVETFNHGFRMVITNSITLPICNKQKIHLTKGLIIIQLIVQGFLEAKMSVITLLFGPLKDGGQRALYFTREGSQAAKIIIRCLIEVTGSLPTCLFRAVGRCQSSVGSFLNGSWAGHSSQCGICFTYSGGGHNVRGGAVALFSRGSASGFTATTRSMDLCIQKLCTKLFGNGRLHYKRTYIAYVRTYIGAPTLYQIFYDSRIPCP